MKRVLQVGCLSVAIGVVGSFLLAAVIAPSLPGGEPDVQAVATPSEQPPLRRGAVVSSAAAAPSENVMQDLSWLDEDYEDLASEAVRARFALLPDDFEVFQEEVSPATWLLLWDSLELWLAGVALDGPRLELALKQSTRCIDLMRRYQARLEDISERSQRLPVSERFALPGLHQCITCKPTAMTGCDQGATVALRLLVEHDRIARTP